MNEKDLPSNITKLPSGGYKISGGTINIYTNQAGVAMYLKAWAKALEEEAAKYESSRPPSIPHR